jgi:hypothetical protein
VTRDASTARRRARRAGSVTAAGAVRYVERLATPIWWYGAAVVVAVLLAVEFALAVSGWLAAVPFVVLVPLSLVVVWRMSAGRLVITDRALVAGGRSIDRSMVVRIIPLRPAELRRLVGRHSDPSSFVWIRSWIGPGMQLMLAEGAAEPYWVVSTRHPERVAAALAAG